MTPIKVFACSINLLKEMREDQMKTYPWDTSIVADSLASMITEWVDEGNKLGTDWRPGLKAVIQKRLQRFHPSLANMSTDDPAVGCGESASERSANEKQEHRLRSLEERVTVLEKP